MLLVSPSGSPLKEPIWENVEVGEPFGPIDFVIDDHQVKSYAYAIDEYHPWFFSNSPFGTRISPAALLTNPLLGIYYLGYNGHHVAGLHAREEFELYGPIRVGQRVTLRGAFTDKFVKRGRGYTVLTAEARDEHGKVLIRNIGTEIFRIPHGLTPGQRSASPMGRPVTGELVPGAPIVEHASHDTPVGAVLPPCPTLVTFEQMTVFSFGTRNIHTDREAASNAGLAAPIAQGLMSTGYLSKLLTSFFGIHWFLTGQTSHAFLKPVAINDVITSYGVIRERDVQTDGVRFVLDVWCRNQAGDLTTVGTASAIVR